jgi:hypothetical protein
MQRHSFQDAENTDEGHPAGEIEDEFTSSPATLGHLEEGEEIHERANYYSGFFFIHAKDIPQRVEVSRPMAH